jgi:hypothetical protein
MEKIENTFTMSEAAPLIKLCIEYDKPVMVWGGTGIGKSSLFRQLAALMGRSLITTIASVKQPVDLAGLPVADIDNNTCRWLRPEDMPREDRDGSKGIWFFDEINTCPPSMQAALFQIILDARINGHEVPAGWARVAAGNRLTDRAAAQRMPTALRNRFAHFNIEPDVNSFAEWASANGVHPMMIGFLKRRPELLHLQPGHPASASDRITIAPEANAFPSPRSWVAANPFIDNTRLVGTFVGEGAAMELAAFIGLLSHTPTFDEIAKAPKACDIPEDTSARYAVSSMIAHEVNAATLDAAFTYLARLGAEWEQMVAVDISRRKPDLTELGAYTRWAGRNIKTVF